VIVGIGTDLVDIRRIERALARHGDRFANRIFTPVERALAERRSNPAATYAKRFAAKEACAKALGTGFRAGIFFRDFGVVNLASGKPTMALTGAALARLRSLMPHGLEAQIDLAISDEYPMAQAFVVISAVPIKQGSPAQS
jgi:holo-[acyl-carrier protein] synthase